MILLGIRTDAATVQFLLYKDSERLFQKDWEADRTLARGLLEQLEIFVLSQDLSFKDIEGLFIFEGPGSFTGLRIGMSVMNTFAYSESIPIVGSRGEDWEVKAVARLIAREDDKLVLPFYGAEARITQPKK